MERAPPLAAWRLGHLLRGFPPGEAGGRCQGDETPVPRPRYLKDLSRAAPGPSQDHKSTSGGPLSCRDVADGRVPGTSHPVSRAPAPTPQPAFGAGEGVPVARKGQTQCPPPSGAPRSPGLCDTSFHPAHHTRLGAEQRLRAPLGGQGRGLRDGRACGKKAAGGEPQGGARSHREAGNPVSSEGRSFSGACEPFTVPPQTMGQPAPQCSRGGNMVEPQLPGRRASCGISRGAEGGP